MYRYLVITYLTIRSIPITPYIPSSNLQNSGHCAHNNTSGHANDAATLRRDADLEHRQDGLGFGISGNYIGNRNDYERVKAA